MLELSGKFKGVYEDVEEMLLTEEIEFSEVNGEIIGKSVAENGKEFSMKVITKIEDLIIMTYQSGKTTGVCVFTNITENSAEGIYIVRKFESVKESCGYYKITKE